MDVTAHEHIAVTVARRHRVVVEPIAHQRQRGDTRRELLAGVVRRRRRRLEGGKVALQPLADLERCSLRSENVHSADGWEGVLKPVATRYQSRSRACIFAPPDSQILRFTSIWRPRGSNM